MSGMSQYQEYIAMSRYARWIEGENRRETWEETVDRYVDFFKERMEADGVDEVMVGVWDKAVRDGIKNMQAMPSMRCLMTAGKALEKDEMAGYNCSFVAIDHLRTFDEIMYVLMCGTGVGFSVERQFVQKLPEIAEDFYETDTVIHVPDSKVGWAKSFKELISMLYAGQIPQWDVSKVRPAGEKLKTFGGRASGPEPLVELFNFTVNLIKKAAGRRLSSLECHDLVCKIAEIVVVGGVRRSALISLSNLSDDRMRNAKNGAWWENEGQRALANNSYAATEKPEFQVFLQEWITLHESKSGERGIFSRIAAQKQAAKNGRRDADYEFGTNPCSEIILRSAQVCNLSEVVVRAEDDIKTLKNKVRIAAIMGTVQSTLTNFRYVRNIWKRNTEEERLLGVSLTGICDHPILGDCTNEELPKILEELREVAVQANKDWAATLGIPQSTAITCVKPSGTVSQLTDTASGIHPRFSPYYIRRVRGDSKDPMSIMLRESGVPCEQDVMNPSALVFSFPQKAPEGALCAEEMGAVEQLNLWMVYQKHWCEHKVSMTCYYSDDEFLDVGGWIWKNFDEVSGISFLPRADHNYRQAPFEECNREQYEELLARMPEMDWSQLKKYELEDTTTGTQELACKGNVCEITDITM